MEGQTSPDEYEKEHSSVAFVSVTLLKSVMAIFTAPSWSNPYTIVPPCFHMNIVERVTLRSLLTHTWPCTCDLTVNFVTIPWR